MGKTFAQHGNRWVIYARLADIDVWQCDKDHLELRSVRSMGQV